MPSVGMRRSTRVFGARVLRSGRRLSTARRDGSKNVTGAHGESKWTELLDKSADGGGDARDCYKDMRQKNENNDSVDVTAEPRVEGSAEVKNVDKIYGIYYKRKRKRMELRKTGLTVDKRYGKKFARKQWRKQCRPSESFEICGVGGFQEFVLVVNESAYDCGYWICCLLTSVLSYMTKVRIQLRQLSAFLLSEPIFGAYSSCGLLFLQDSVTTKNPGVCVISGSRSLIPLFSVSSSAIPSLFMHMQTSMHLRFSSLACMLVAHSLGFYEEDENVMRVADDDYQDCIAVASTVSLGFTSRSSAIASDNDRWLSHSAAGLPKSALRNIQTRNSRKIQKRRSSLRRNRGRPPLAFQSQKTSGALSSGVFKFRQEGVKVFAGAPSHVLRSLDKRSSTVPNKELKSTLGVLMRDAHASSCSANLLVSQRDKCYREGATVSLESSASNQWSVTVSANGTKRYSLAARKVMRPSCNNRFTHAIIWTSDVGWKLEFPNKQDWLIFKELYKECYERNMQSPATSVIPVPRVQEVSSTVEMNYLPYVRPDSYITMKDDELIRALARKTANYDMDSDDEVWLEKLNEELCAGREQRELITPDSFELIVDTLEKGFHCNPDEHLDEQVSYDIFMHLEGREVIEAIRNYWIKKRKQNQSAFVRIFQLYHSRRTQVILKPVLRKKRSLKRHASQGGRGKQQPLLQAIAAEQDASDQQNIHKQQEAKAAAERSEGLAIQKRQRAQMLVENADLATYKALMALRIAEAAQIAESPDMVSSSSLG